LGLDVSVKYVQGGENLDGFRTELVETPFSTAETLDKRPSIFAARRSPTHVTTVCDGFVFVWHPRRPADVANANESSAYAIIGSVYGCCCRGVIECSIGEVAMIDDESNNRMVSRLQKLVTLPGRGSIAG